MRSSVEAAFLYQGSQVSSIFRLFGLLTFDCRNAILPVMFVAVNGGLPLEEAPLGRSR